ncbi:MAG: hypothetical protein ACXVCS_01945, partial [Bdellovibrionota bacterium]
VFSASPPAAITDANLQTSLSTELNDIAAPFGAPDDHAIYLIELPQGTSLSIGAASTCMNHFEEYFNTYTDGASGKTITYAVIAHCASDTIDDSTRRMSEEIVDAATDPDIGLSYHGVDSDSLVWSIAYGGRLASLCDVEPDFVHQNIITPSDIGFVILRAWSNSAAVSGQDPCRPSPTQFYFNSAPVLPDTVTFFDSDFGQSFTTKGVHIPLNSTRTLTLQLFSTGDIAPWSLALGQYSNDLAFQTVTHSFDRSSGSNGTIVHLNLTPTATDPEYGGELMEIRSTYNGHTNVWPFIITN